MARYNSVNTTTSIAGGTTIYSPASGLLTTLTGTGTVTIPNPILYTGQTQTFYNSTGSAITLNTPSGNFTGAGASGNGNLTVPGSSVVTVVSDGANYIVQAWIGGTITVGGTLTANGAVAMNPTGLNVSIQPTGTGTLTLSSGITGTLDNINIGSTIQGTGNFTTLSSNGATSFTASTAITLGTAASGALQVTGGVGVGGGITVTGNSYFGGNVGVNVTNPLAKLHIGLTGQTNAATTTVSNLTAFATSARAGFDGLANNNDGIYFGMGINGGINAGLGFFREAAGWNSAISFYTNNVTDGINVTAMQEKMRLNSAGYLGIGTSLPTTVLTLKKPIDSTAYGSGTRMIDFQSYFPGYDVNTIKASIYSGVSGIGTLNTQGGFLAFYTSNNGTNAERMRIEKDGTIGIGTTNTNTVTGNYTFNVALRARFNGMMLGNSDGTNASDNRIQFDWSSGSNAYIYAQQNVPFYLGTNNTNQLTLQSGNVSVSGSLTKNSYATDGFYSFMCTSGGSYVHMKTNMSMINIMFMIEAKGYNYGSVQTISSQWSGYTYSGTNSVINISVSNAGAAALANNVYTSSDKYAVIVAYLPSTYYSGFVLNQVCANPTGAGFQISITAVTQTGSNSGAY
jgi:hypothetical protein